MAKEKGPSLSQKDADKAKNALLRIAKFVPEKATDAQKQKVAQDIINFGTLLGIAWDLIVAVLKQLNLPVPSAR